MRILDKVRVADLRAPMLIALYVADQSFRDHGYDMIWSCGPEGEHSFGSLHYLNCAVDVDYPGLSESDFRSIRNDIKTRLGNNFDVINEGSHIHIELQPKEPK